MSLPVSQPSLQGRPELSSAQRKAKLRRHAQRAALLSAEKRRKRPQRSTIQPKRLTPCVPNRSLRRDCSLSTDSSVLSNIFSSTQNDVQSETQKNVQKNVQNSVQSTVQTNEQCDSAESTQVISTSKCKICPDASHCSHSHSYPHSHSRSRSRSHSPSLLPSPSTSSSPSDSHSDAESESDSQSSSSSGSHSSSHSRSSSTEDESSESESDSESNSDSKESSKKKGPAALSSDQELPFSPAFQNQEAYFDAQVSGVNGSLGPPLNAFERSLQKQQHRQTLFGIVPHGIHQGKIYSYIQLPYGGIRVLGFLPAPPMMHPFENGQEYPDGPLISEMEGEEGGEWPEDAMEEEGFGEIDESTGKSRFVAL